MFWIGLIIGLVLGAVFHFTLTKWFNRGKKVAQTIGQKGKEVAQEISHDLQADYEKMKRR